MKMSRYIKQYKWHLIILFILIIIAGISWNYKIADFRFQIEDSKENIATTNEPTNKSKILNLKSKITNYNNIEIKIIINGKEYTSNLTTTTTIYQLMQNLSASSIKPFSFTTKEYTGMGHFVEEINGIKNNPQENKYWIYYINGETAKLGISTQIVKPGDLIEWTYGKSNF